MDVAKDIEEDREVSKKPSVKRLLFENLLTVAELAEDLGCAKVTIYKWVGQQMPSRKVRGRRYFSPEEVALWLQRTTKE